MNKIYYEGFKKLMDAGKDNLTIKYMLLDSGYTLDQSEATISTAAGNEVSGTGYSRKTVSSFANTVNASESRIEIDTEDFEWSTYDAGQTDSSIMYIEITDDTDSIPLFYIDEGFPLNISGGPLAVDTPNNIININL